MNTLESLITDIVKDNEKHARWLNTLSMMENTGAKKISAAEDGVKVTTMILKHAAEEARHAYYLKKQLPKLGYGAIFDHYRPDALLSPIESMQYLHRLDVEICRFLKEDYHLKGRELVFAAYLLVTYGIEVRAGELYPIYQKILDGIGAKVNVKSIIAEEETHLEEMLVQMKAFFGDKWEDAARRAETIEKKFFGHWLQALRHV